MKSIFKINSIICLLFISTYSYAQQDPMYTHYMFNTLVINPGYAGSRDAFTVTALHRSQWLNYRGAPITQTLTMHTPLRNQHLGIGLSVMNDKIGPVNNTTVIADVAYIMHLSRKSKLALGLSGGANIWTAKLSTLELDQTNDPLFQTNFSNKLTGKFGFGAYYSLERIYVGVSIPNLLENKLSKSASNGTILYNYEQRHYYLIGGALMHLTDKLDLKPTTLIKVTDAAPIEADFTASFIYNNRFTLGVMARTGDALGALIGFQITNQFYLGYSFDYSMGLETAHYNSGSHELVLRYDCMSYEKRQIHSPRYF